MTPNPAPLWEQIAIVLIGPPVMVGAWWVLSRGWAKTVQGGMTSNRSKRRQKVEFWGLLIAMYLLTLGMSLYAWFKR